VRTVYWVAKYLQYIAGAGVIALMLLQVANMVGRVIFGSPIQGTTDIGSYMLLVVTALGLGWAALEGRHIKVDLVTDRLPAKARLAIAVVILTITLGVVIYVTYVNAWAALTWPERTTSVLKIPYKPFRLLLSLGFGVLGLCTLVVLVNTIRSRDGSSHES
jgi:TRAP-type C4-dicarboxylate transport system permease small subunit